MEMRPLQKKSRNLHAWELVTAFKVSNCAAFHSSHCTVPEMGHQYADWYRPFKAGHHLWSPETCSALRVLTGKYLSRRNMWFCVCTAHFFLRLALSPTSDSSHDFPTKLSDKITLKHREHKIYMMQLGAPSHEQQTIVLTNAEQPSGFPPVWHPFIPFLTFLLFGQAPSITWFKNPKSSYLISIIPTAFQ